MTAAHFYQVWAVIGPFVGILTGSWLASRWQRRQWIRDNKKLEYRAIFEALSKFGWATINYYALYDESPFKDPAAEGKKCERQEEIGEAMHSVMAAFGSCIFTRSSVLIFGVMRDFQDFYHSLENEKPPSYESVAHTLALIQKKVLHMASGDLGMGWKLPAETQEMREFSAEHVSLKSYSSKQPAK